MDDMRPISEVAELVGVNRITLGRWLRSGLLKKQKPAMMRNLQATLISVSEVRAVKGRGKLKPGPRVARPRRKPQR